ncbi:MAG: thioredoxin TrxC [Desulfuromonas sp.]|nr:MAG: thioredoxin TrxC [Desulfuromonas sp.]
MAEALHIVCPHCQAVNRLPETRLVEHPKCGSCTRLLFVGEPVELTAATFAKHRDRNDIPLLIDCWAPWCGPCQAMAPAFTEAARQLEPRLRLAKVNTESEPQLGAQLNIRSIPTLVLYRRGKEIARQSGVVSTAQLVRWVRGLLG